MALAFLAMLLVRPGMGVLTGSDLGTVAGREECELGARRAGRRLVLSPELGLSPGEGA